MKTPFFDTPDKKEMLIKEARLWVGTPFVPFAMVKGAGADCIHLAAGLYLACGVFKEFKPMRYSLDEGSHCANSKILAWLNVSSNGFEQVNKSVLLTGDLVIFRIATVEHHVGVVLDNGDFIHALPDRQVTICNFKESLYRKRVTACYRPQKEIA